MKKILNNNLGFTRQKERLLGGFTLTELLVAASLFIIVLTFGTNIYLSITNTQKSNYSMQKILNDSRFLLDMIAQDIQNNYIDYQPEPAYPAAVIPEDELRLKMSDGSLVIYSKELDAGINRLKRSVNGNPTTLSSAYINITQLDFYIYPLMQNETEVPFVVIVWQAEEVGPTDPVEINLQTAISLRNY